MAPRVILDGTVRIVRRAPNSAHTLLKTRGRYYDYTPGEGLSRLGRKASDHEAVAVWLGRIRAGRMDI